MSEWRQEPFNSVIADESGGNLKTPQSEYLASGRYAVVDQGKDLIAGYTDDESRLCRAQLPVIVFGDHTRCIKYVDFPFCMGADGVKVLRPKSEGDVKYLYHYLRQLRLPEGGYDRHFKYLKRTSVTLPPVSEQQRIAEILDKADALRANRRAALAQLDTLTQSIFLDMFGDPATNPKGWPREALTSACHCYSGGTPAKENEGNWVGSLPWFSPKDLKQDDLFDSEDHISEEIPMTTSLKRLPADTVAIVVRGMILAHTFPVSVLRVPATVNQDLKALLPRRPIDAQFLAHCLRVQSTRALGHVSASAHGTKRLDADGLERLHVLNAPAKLQSRFADLVKISQQSQCALKTSLAELDALFASLQDRAFRGEL